MRKKFLVEQKYLLILKIKSKMKNLQEMSLNEMRKTEGGYWWVPVLGYILFETVTNPKSSWESYKKGYDATNK